MWALIFVIAATSRSHVIDDFSSKERCEKAGQQIVEKVNTPSQKIGGTYVCVRK